MSVYSQEWPVETGDYIEVTEKVEGKGRGLSKYRGKVVAVTPAFLVVDKGKYRVTVLKAVWVAGLAMIKRKEARRQENTKRL